MADPIGYWIPLTKKEERSFVGGVLLSSNLLPEDLHNKLCNYFPKAFVQRIEDHNDYKLKSDNDIKKVTNKAIRLEEKMWQSLNKLKMWTLEEVENWLAVEVEEDEARKKKDEVVKVNNEQPLKLSAASSTPRFQDSSGEQLVIDKENEELQVVTKLKIKEIVYTLDEKFLGECLTDVDQEEGVGNLTKDKFAKMFLELLPSLICENAALKKKLKIAEDLIVTLTKEGFERNTIEIGLRGELDALKKKQEEQQKGQQSVSLINQLMQKLEVMDKCQKENQKEEKTFREEMEKQVEETKKHTENVVNILGGIKTDLQKYKRNSGCKMKTGQEIENSEKTVTFFGSQVSLKYFDKSWGDFRRDLDSLRKRKIVSVEVTDQPGVESIMELVQKVEEKRSLAVIVLNVAAETAEVFLGDEQYGNVVSSQLGLVVNMLVKCAKAKFDEVTFILPPHTPQSFSLIEKLSKTLSEGGFDVINISQLQLELGKQCQADATWKIESQQSMKQFVVTEDEILEGWNLFSFNAMITQVSAKMVGNRSILEWCLVCGLGHSKTSQCQNSLESREGNKTEGSYSYNASSSSENGSFGSRSQKGQDVEFSETCLKCFKAHDETNCYVSESLRCNYQGCFRKGHLRTVHFPRKKETVDRLIGKYGPSFSFVSPDSRKRDVGRDLSRETKRSKGGNEKR